MRFRSACISAAFIRVVGSEFVQKYLGEGPRMVRDVFRLAKENAPAIIFIDEIDAIATKRFDAQTGGMFTSLPFSLSLSQSLSLVFLCLCPALSLLVMNSTHSGCLLVMKIKTYVYFWHCILEPVSWSKDDVRSWIQTGSVVCLSNKPVSPSAVNVGYICHLGASLFEDVSLVEFMYVVFMACQVELS